jgi:Tfp pilus assembly PilM family ATPase
MFAEVKLRVDVIQSDAIAMYNFLLHEEFNEKIAFLDLGSDKANMLIVGTDGVLQINSLAFGIQQFNRSFRETFDMTHEEAERLVWQPETAPDLYRLFETTNEILENFTQKVSRTLQPYEGSPWTEPVEQLYLTGGGIRFHGLLSYLRHGPGG